LLSNGIRHAKSCITIKSLLIDKGTNTVITVRDDGDGFTTEDLEHAFDYFYSGAKSGSGLGLTIVKKIIEEHLGAIRIYNDNGAVVEIILPVQQD
jgi:signal transduction histidine kinase